MNVESLAGLKKAFAAWRRKKRYVREPVPDDLMDRVREAAKVHGAVAVARVTGIERRRLEKATEERRDVGGGVEPTKTPAYSRLELVSPMPAARPVAEVETPAGVKLRIFTPTQEVLGLIATVCGSAGGVR